MITKRIWYDEIKCQWNFIWFTNNKILTNENICAYSIFSTFEYFNKNTNTCEVQLIDDRENIQDSFPFSPYRLISYWDLLLALSLSLSLER